MTPSFPTMPLYPSGRQNSSARSNIRTIRTKASLTTPARVAVTAQIVTMMTSTTATARSIHLRNGGGGDSL